MIDSQQLRVFVTLASVANMSRAAQELGITPSGVSHCLKALEEDLGCQLFERSSRSMSISNAGQLFLPEATAILDRMKTARNKVKSLADRRKGPFRLTANTTACHYILPPVLREFRESLPECTVLIHVAETSEAAELLANKEIDLALTIEPQKHAGTQFLRLAEEQLKIVVNPLHRWSARPRFQRSEISQENLILPQRTSETYRLIEAYFQRKKIRIHPFIEIGDEEAIKHFVRLDLGVGIFPTWIARPEIEQGSLRALPLGHRKLVRYWGILSQKNRIYSFAENLFIGICRNILPDLIKERR